jgi:polysaccharide pyruvyl transferase CsaB
LYYLGIIFLAKFLEKPVMIYAQGVGPLKKNRNKKLTAWLLNKVNRITVRDQESKDDLLAMGVQQKITVTADPVLSLDKGGVNEKLGWEILERYGIKKEEEQKLLGVYLRSWGKNAYLSDLADALNKMSEKGWKIVFVPMQFPGDITVAKEAEQLLINDSVVILRENYTPEEIISITKNFDLIVGMRLHSLIMAAVAGVPIVGLSYDPKVDRFLHQVGQIALISVNNLKAQTLLEMLTWTDEKRDDIVVEMETRTQVMYQKAWQTARIAMNLIKDFDSGGE